MKYCFLANDAAFLMEFLGKLAHEAVKQGDECVIVYNSKISEWNKRKFFPDKAIHLSKVDWCAQYYDRSQQDHRASKLSWKDFFSTFDRYKTKFDYKRAFDIISQLSQFTEFVLEKEKPDILVSEIPSGIHNEIALKFCQKRNIPYIGFTDSMFDTLALYDKGLTDSRFEQTFSRITSEGISQEEKAFAGQWIENYISHKQVPGYDKVVKTTFSQTGLLRHYARRLGDRGGLLLKYMRGRNKFKDYDFESEALLRHNLEAPFEMERRQMRMRTQKRFYEDLDENDKFFLYPLQYQPEASSSVMAPYFCNQTETIKNIAFALPFPYKLYVKEHPIAVGKKPDEFYEELQRIPNVKIIRATEPAAKLIQAAKGVVVLSSTMGLEAALSGKSVYVFGDVFYLYHPFCKKIESFEQLRKAILEDLHSPLDRAQLQDINARFVASYRRHTIPGDIAAASFKHDTNNYSHILSALRERVQ